VTAAVYAGAVRRSAGAAIVWSASVSQVGHGRVGVLAAIGTTTSKGPHVGQR
jgi:hypothetical protein